MNLKKTFLPAVVAAVLTTPALSAAEVEFSYAPSTRSYQQWGTEKTYENYDIAIRLDDPMLVGRKIVSMSVPIQYSPYITEVSGWLTSELKLSGKNNVADIATVKSQIVNNNLEVIFPEPYTITEDGVYVGYTISIGTAATGPAANPVTVVSGSRKGSFYVHTSRIWMSWSDLSEKLDLTSMIAVGLDGEFVSDAVSVRSLPDIMADPDTEAVIPTVLRNDGSNSISSIEYEVATGGKKTVMTHEFKNPVMPRYLEEKTVNLPIGIIDVIGRTTYSLTVTGVNGKANESPAPTASGNVDVVAYRPVNRPLLEEYTGFTCGYCTRGIAALERMYHLYPDDFIGVAFHSNDDLAITSNFANPADALPTAWMNRSIQCDPYMGTAGSGFGIETLWNEVRSKEVPVGINLNVNWADDELTKIKADAEVVFIRPADQQYSLVYMLVTGGLSNDEWYQNNYYSGNSPAGWVEEMQQFLNADKIIRGLVYNDVVAMTSDLKGIAGSLPASPEVNAINSHSYTFDLENCYSRSRVYMAPDKKNIRVVCSVLDASGAAVNSFIATPGTNGVEEPAAARKVVATEVYDLGGRRMQAMPESGVYILRETLEDGSVRCRKVMI